MSVTRREFVSLAAATAALLAAPRSLADRGPAAGRYARSFVIDGLGGPGGPDTEQGSPLSPRELEDVRSSGITAFNLTVGAVGTMPPLEAFEKIVRDIARWEGEIERSPAVLARIRGVEDLRAAKRDGRAGLIYGLQDGVAFEDDLERLTALRQLGIRVIQPTYNRRNLLGDGCMERADAGLSKAGVEAVQRLNALGILLDLSHCGRRTTADAIAAASRPMAFTHTGCAALAEHPRHRTDAEMRAVAERGGVTGIYVMPYLAQGRQPVAADVIAHLEHAVAVCGEDHVSIGTDGGVSPVVVTQEYAAKFRENTQRRRELGVAAPYETDEGYLFANDLNTPRRLETLADMLVARGHPESRVEKLLGANLLRVFGEAWQPARSA